MAFQQKYFIGRGILILIISLVLAIKYIFIGIYSILIERYYRNFTNKEIDTKIFSTQLFFEGIGKVFFGLLSSFLLRIMPIENAFIVLGITFFVLLVITLIYMKFNLGLKPEKYNSKEIYTSYYNQK